MNAFTIALAGFLGAAGYARASEDNCAAHLEGARVLIEINPKLHTQPSVEARAKRQASRDQRTRVKPADKVAAWLNALEDNERWLREHPARFHHAKAFVYRRVVIKPEDVPEGYFQMQARILRNEGYGDVEITSEMRHHILNLLVKDQEQSLEPWLNYLLSAGADYPTWMKYWILIGVSKLSIYDPERRTFGIRNEQTVAPFPDLNPEALAQVKQLMLLRLDRKALGEVQDRQIAQLVRTSNFGQLYGHEINNLSQYGNRPFTTNEGRWVRYPRGSDHIALVDSLVGQNTGWCTVGRATAQDQLSGGDFHVYYTLDEKGEFTRPRLAIRMQGDQIGEIRGVGRDQEFDPLISQSGVLEDKLKDFGPEAEIYRKRSRDMKQLTEIDERISKQGSLTITDLRFLREIDRKIEGFGHSEDPRLQELLAGRDRATDIGLIFDVPPAQVALDEKDLRSGGHTVYVGDLVAKNLDSIPSRAVVGDLSLRECSASSIHVPAIEITERLSVDNCAALDSVIIDAKVPRVFVGYTRSVGKIRLSPDVQDFELAVTYVGDLRGLSHLEKFQIKRLETAGHLELPATQENWKLEQLASVETLIVASKVKSLYLPELRSARSISLADDLASLRLSKLEDLSAIQNLPADLKELSLGAIPTVPTLVLPPKLERLWLDAVVSAKDLPALPASLKSLELDNLEDAEGLILPENLETLWLPKLRSARALKRPARLEQMIYRGPMDFKD